MTSFVHLPYCLTPNILERSEKEPELRCPSGSLYCGRSSSPTWVVVAVSR